MIVQKKGCDPFCGGILSACGMTRCSIFALVLILHQLGTAGEGMLPCLQQNVIALELPDELTDKHVWLS